MVNAAASSPVIVHVRASPLESVAEKVLITPVVFSSTLTKMVLRPAPIVGGWFVLGMVFVVAVLLSDQELSPSSLTACTCTW